MEISEEELAMSTKNALSVFGNLPLCVSIYSSLQAACSRRLVDVEFNLLCKEAFLLVKWKVMEREFGDRFHFRRLTGTSEIAETIINSKPLVLLLLAKVS